jgi:hypothetical protein
VANTKDPTIGRLRYVLKDKRSRDLRRRPVLLEYPDPSQPALHITLQKALRLQRATLQVAAPSTSASAMVAMMTPTIGQTASTSTP